MSLQIDWLIGLSVAGLLFAYLLYALLRAEKL